MKLSKLLRFSLLAFGTSKAYSAIDADGAVDGVFTPEAAAAFNSEKPGLVTVLVDMVAAATPNLRSIDSSFDKEEGFLPLLRGSSKGKVIPEIVDCINGKTSSGETCEAACNNGIDCCGGVEACVAFTGKVAKDGSCMGDYACKNAGDLGGSVGLISGTSCVGYKACLGVGSGILEGGSVGDISEASCVGKFACREAGSIYGGSVGLISGGSCVGEEACYKTGSLGGSVGSISGASCIANQACSYLGAYEGVGDLAGCCTTYLECYKVRAIAGLPATCTTTPPPTPNPTPAPTPKACKALSQGCNAFNECCDDFYCSGSSKCFNKKEEGEKCALGKECISGRCSWMKCKQV